MRLCRRTVDCRFSTDRFYNPLGRSAGGSPATAKGLRVRFPRSSRYIDEDKEEHRVKERTRQGWFNGFNSESLTLVDHSRSGTRPVRDIETIKEAVKTNLAPALADCQTPLNLLKAPYIAT
ncbi:hypothetical protein EVAR_6703_1 [Eumeta japonica]|uniref:Uncharacterized protein n=1 Tax=Eumeta variegata TaxID=151549 RepID=A0A4C1TKM8_EUMVA|nr:hypothetical protein EVAR_6703_1 [Eumeta japonica]